MAEKTPPTPITVSFVIPCYNHGKFVRDAVASCLAQEETEARVVVVNDGSDDGMTTQACDECKNLPGWIEVVHQRNRGLPAARNTGAERASHHESEFLCFLDADDTIEPSFARKLAGAIHQSSDNLWSSAQQPGSVGEGNVSHAYCQERLTDRAFGTWTVPAWDPLLLLITNLHPVTTLIRRECFEQVGGFDESMRKGYEDWDLWLRFAAKSWRGVRVREPLFNWRRHSEITMVMESVRHHEELFRFLVNKHKSIYEQHALELLIRSNVLLRKADANWLDENLDAIYVRDLRNRNIELHQEVVQARAKIEEVQAQAERQMARLASSYENKPVIRLSRRIYSIIDALPGPMARGIKRLIGNDRT